MRGRGVPCARAASRFDASTRRRARENHVVRVLARRVRRGGDASEDVSRVRGARRRRAIDVVRRRRGAGDGDDGDALASVDGGDASDER